MQSTFSCICKIKNWRIRHGNSTINLNIESTHWNLISSTLKIAYLMMPRYILTGKKKPRRNNYISSLLQKFVQITSKVDFSALEAKNSSTCNYIQQTGLSPFISIIGFFCNLKQETDKIQWPGIHNTLYIDSMASFSVCRLFFGQDNEIILPRACMIMYIS